MVSLGSGIAAPEAITTSQCCVVLAAVQRFVPSESFTEFNKHNHEGATLGTYGSNEPLSPATRCKHCASQKIDFRTHSRASKSIEPTTVKQFGDCLRPSNVQRSGDSQRLINEQLLLLHAPNSDRGLAAGAERGSLAFP